MTCPVDNAVPLLIKDTKINLRVLDLLQLQVPRQRRSAMEIYSFFFSFFLPLGIFGLCSGVVCVNFMYMSLYSCEECLPCPAIGLSPMNLRTDEERKGNELRIGGDFLAAYIPVNDWISCPVKQASP